MDNNNSDSPLTKNIIEEDSKPEEKNIVNIFANDLESEEEETVENVSKSTKKDIPEQDLPPSDEELLAAYIGKNSEKIMTRPFNFAGFFFTSLYMCYRKMFSLGILTFIIHLVLLNVTDKMWLALIVNILVGISVNKIYVSRAKRDIDAIRLSYYEKNYVELKAKCAKKGGRSVGKVILGLIVQFIIALAALIAMAIIGISNAVVNLINFDDWNLSILDLGPKAEVVTIEDVNLSGYVCVGSKCNVTIEKTDGTSEEYTVAFENTDLFKKLGDYKDYIKLDVNCQKKKIVGYKIYLRSNNEDVSSITSENELREKLELYTIGSHTDVLVLKEIGETGYGFMGAKSYSYTYYTFTDSKNNDYVMKYINNNKILRLTEGKKYTISFDIVEGDFGLEYNLNSMQEYFK